MVVASFMLFGTMALGWVEIRFGISGFSNRLASAFGVFDTGIHELRT